MEKISVDILNDLFKGFGIAATCVDAFRHRHFTYYDVKLEHGTKISKLDGFVRELTVAMQARSDLIVEPIPEKGVVRLRTTHEAPQPITVDELYKIHRDTRPEGILQFLLGETEEGNPLWTDLSKHPHTLIGGATGSGKSVMLHNLIHNACKRGDVMLSLIDTKYVEFGTYKDVKMKEKVRYLAQTYDMALLVLERMEVMMNKTYEYMAKNGLQSVEDAPELFQKQLVVIDEVADLMLQDKEKKFENLIVSLAQKARAAGIYLVLATQRPSTDVLTGLIKSNFPARLATRCSTKVDSRVILDQQGAENLSGRGDAILKLPSGDSIRFQVGYSDPKLVLASLPN